MSNLTINECRAEMDRDLAFKTSSGDVGVELFEDFLNEMEDIYYDLLIEAAPTRFLVPVAVSTATNPTTISELYTLDVTGGGVFESNANGTITDNLLRYTRRGASHHGYWVESLDDEAGAKIHFTPLDVGTNTKWVVYIPYRTIKTGNATTLFPKRKAHLVKRALLRTFWLWRGSSEANVQDSEYRSALMQLLKSANPRPDNVDLGINSF